MKDKPQQAMELIKALTASEKKLIYNKLHEELNYKLIDLLDAGCLTPSWLDS
ncbi:hypothetical protein [Candidatus Hakubella thermalkaliphila]|uniref:hypothetical protein n=1 Tax=Candidatus Hakubella thermalkaliphila TaxID=2754717 RepID=UPI001593B28C|nr:hypothetical protein [Candidatus Hakubella thermalkaliphila]